MASTLVRRQTAVVVRNANVDPYSPKGTAQTVLREGRATLSLFWSVFWKVTAVTTALFVLLFFSLRHDELAEPFLDVAFFVAVVLGYCVFYASWVGLAAGTFAIAWRWCGAWIIVPIVGAVLGAVAAVGLAFVILRGMDLRGAGVHGGGDIAAFLLLGFLAVVAVIGAIAGGILAGVPAVIVALTIRRRRRASDDVDKPSVPI
ncbi:MAG: hypothetical protein KatS3mg105_3020 [Gemmatales bacterium]|nr:MAG: hypothetical protein KatS3mg105_3020 [Gemmatales bacterium]